MLTRRIFGGCALCTATALLALPDAAQAQAAPGLVRRLVSRADLPGGPYEAVQMVVTIDAGFFVARHTHPGIESSFIRTGGGRLMVQGLPDTEVKPGDSFLVPPGTVHALQTGPASTVVEATYVVEKGKPLASPA